MERIDELSKIKENYIKDKYEYEKSVIDNIGWDYIIISVNDEYQKEYAEKQLDLRKREKMISEKTIFLVITQLDKNVGSGGLFLYLLDNYNLPLNSNILYIQSAGKSQRTPYYASKGKVWATIQRRKSNGKLSTVFDEILIQSEKIRKKMSGGILISCGDVIVLTESNILIKDDSLLFSTEENIEVGQNHGVFKVNKKNILEKTFQKQSKEKLINEDAVTNGKVKIDTGLLLLSGKLLNKLREICNKEIFKETFLNLYVDLLYPLSLRATFLEYLKEESEEKEIEKLTSARNVLWDNLKKENIQVLLMKNGKFIHLGTTNDILKNKRNSLFRTLGWNENILLENGQDIKIKDNYYLENSKLEISEKLLNNSLIFNSNVNIKLPDNSVLYTVKTRENKYISVLYSTEDNLKAKEKNITIFGINLIDYINKQNIKRNKIFENNDIDFWNAKLFSEENTEEEALNASIDLYNNLLTNTEKFENSKRMSLKEIIEVAKEID